MSLRSGARLAVGLRVGRNTKFGLRFVLLIADGLRRLRGRHHHADDTKDYRDQCFSKTAGVRLPRRQRQDQKQVCRLRRQRWNEGLCDLLRNRHVSAEWRRASMCRVHGARPSLPRFSCSDAGADSEASAGTGSSSNYATNVTDAGNSCDPRSQPANWLRVNARIRGQPCLRRSQHASCENPYSRPQDF